MSPDGAETSMTVGTFMQKIIVTLGFQFANTFYWLKYTLKFQNIHISIENAKCCAVLSSIYNVSSVVYKKCFKNASSIKITFHTSLSKCLPNYKIEN